MPRLSRRTFLRGAGGVAVALPALEIMGPGSIAGGSRALADTGGTPPCRFVTSYGGVSLGDDFCIPTGFGADYTPSRAIASIAELDMQNDVTVVSNLQVPWAVSGALPPGGRSAFYHYNTIGMQIAGTRGGLPKGGKPQGPTADQIVANAIGGDTRFPMIPYRVQPGHYVNGNTIGGDSGRFSWRRNADGELERVDPIVSPRAAYESLFTGFTPTDEVEAERVRRELLHRRSILDFVLERGHRLTARVGARDRQRLERHFDEVRALENRLLAVDPTGGSCRLLEPPGEDPPLGDWFIYEEDGGYTNYSTTRAYSDEDGRADVLSDLIAMAFACDLTRSVSFMITEWKCYMNAFPITGHQDDVHGTTHTSHPEWVADVVNWHVKVFARLARKLRDVPEVDGTTLLDHTAMALLFEGGNGFDPESGNRNSSHSTENMMVLLAGRAGGLRSGIHVDGRGGHPAAAVLAAMRAVGVDGPLGDIEEPLPGLL